MEPMASNSVISLNAEKFSGDCEQHGAFAGTISTILGRTFRTGCPQCSEIRKQQEAAAEHAEVARQAQERAQRKLGAALIPARFVGKSFADYLATTPAQDKALRICSEYAANFADNAKVGRCLLLLGKPGTGKTHLAASIANHIVTHTSSTAVYRTVGGILQYVKGSYDRASEYSEAQAFDSLTKPHLLIIDEVGATKPTEFELATLFQIINGRYEELRPTVVVSNLQAAELVAALGERCVDRLREGGGIAVTFDWKSARKAVTA
jgi:DNA replication protein DnaC